jgi:glutaredoxin 3
MDCIPIDRAPIDRSRIDKGGGRPHFPVMATVEIYTKAFCPYCSRAMRLLDSKGVTPEEFDITLGGPKRAEMIERANGRTTVPQVFIDGRHIGGSDDLAALEQAGKLDALLAA